MHPPADKLSDLSKAIAAPDKSLKIHPLDLDAFLSGDARALLVQKRTGEEFIKEQAVRGGNLHSIYLGKHVLMEPTEEHRKKFAAIVNEAVQRGLLVWGVLSEPLWLPMATGRASLLLFSFSAFTTAQLKMLLGDHFLEHDDVHGGGAGIGTPLEPSPFPDDWTVSPELIAIANGLDEEERSHIERITLRCSMMEVMQASLIPGESLLISKVALAAAEIGRHGDKVLCAVREPITSPSHDATIYFVRRPPRLAPWREIVVVQVHDHMVICEWTAEEWEHELDMPVTGPQGGQGRLRELGGQKLEERGFRAVDEKLLAKWHAGDPEALRMISARR